MLMSVISLSDQFWFDWLNLQFAFGASLSVFSCVSLQQDEH